MSQKCQFRKCARASDCREGPEGDHCLNRTQAEPLVEWWVQQGLTRSVVSPKSKLTKPIKKPKAVWVEPSFMAEVEYRDITSEGLLRQSSFKGLTKR
jgi:hypothetical protein